MKQYNMLALLVISVAAFLSALPYVSSVSVAIEMPVVQRRGPQLYQSTSASKSSGPIHTLNQAFSKFKNKHATQSLRGYRDVKLSQTAATDRNRHRNSSFIQNRISRKRTRSSNGWKEGTVLPRQQQYAASSAVPADKEIRVSSQYSSIKTSTGTKPTAVGSRVKTTFLNFSGTAAPSNKPPPSNSKRSSQLPLGAKLYTGKLFVVPSHSSNDIVLLLRPSNGSIIMLDFGTPMAEPPGGLKANQVVDVVAVLDKESDTLKVIRIAASATAGARIWQGNTGPPSSMRVLFAQVTFCGQSPIFSQQTWRNMIAGSPGSLHSLAQHFQSVSNGNTLLNSFDIIGPIDLGCPTLRTCSTITWQAYAVFEQQVWDKAKSMGLDYTSYGSTVIAWPELGNCWAGLAYIGCYGDYSCVTFLNGAAALNIAVASHEMGHNLGFLHAGYLNIAGQNVEYGDPSSVMGTGSSSYGLTAYNTPEEFQMNWITPQQLDGRSLTPGATVTLSTAALTRSSSHGVRIVPSWNPSAPDVYLGFRVREFFDADLADAIAGRTSIYTWAGSSFSDYYETYWLGGLATGQSYYEPQSGLVTRQLSISPDGGSSTITVCRNTSTAETPATCKNGLDDDCDGLIDAADPDCGQTRPVAASPVAAPPPPPTAGFDWSALPQTSSGTNYAVIQCRKSMYVTSVYLYASSWHYSDSGNVNYLGGVGIQCNDGMRYSRVLAGNQDYRVYTQGGGFTAVNGLYGGSSYSEAALTKAMYGYGAPAHNNGTDLQAVAYSYKPPTSGALMAGIGVSQCAWPPPAGTYGLVLCNIQFAFARQGDLSMNPQPTPSPPSPAPPLPAPGTITRSEQYGIASSSAAPTSQQSLQCSPGSVVIGLVVYQADYDIQYQGYNSSSTYIGGLALRCSDGNFFSNVVAAGYKPQTINQSAGFKSINGLVGQAWSTQYSSTPDYEAGAMKSILGLGDPTSTATSYSFTCPPSTLLFGFTSSKCTLPGVINGDSVADRPAAVFCHFDFSCTVQPDNITPSYTPVWSPVMGSDPPSSASPVSYNALSCNQGSFVTSMTISNSNLVYSTDGSVSFVGGLVMGCSNGALLNYQLQSAISPQYLQSAQGFGSIYGTVGNSYELGLLKSINGFGDSTSGRNTPFTYACAAGQLIQGFAAQQCSVTSGHPNRALCSLQFRCTVSAPPPTSPSPQPPSAKVYSPPRPPPPRPVTKTSTPSNLKNDSIPKASPPYKSSVAGKSPPPMSPPPKTAHQANAGPTPKQTPKPTAKPVSKPVSKPAPRSAQRPIPRPTTRSVRRPPPRPAVRPTRTPSLRLSQQTKRTSG